MKDLVASLKEFIEKHNLITPDKQVFVALSGGVDSVVLTHLLREIGRSGLFHLRAIHINHQLRGESSDKQAEFTKRLMQDWKVPLETFRVDVHEIMEREKLSLEMAARKARLDIYKTILKQYENSLIATAHHRDDHIETVLINFFHGRGLAGLSGIPVKSGRVIHPLVEFSRQEIENYAVKNGIGFYEDESNQDISILRNYIRLQLIPELEDRFNLRLSNSILRFSREVSEIRFLLKSEAEKAFLHCCAEEEKKKIVLEIPLIKKYLNPIRKCMIFHSLDKLTGGGYIPRHTEADGLLRMMETARTGAMLNLRGNVRALIHRNQLILSKITTSWSEQTLPVPGTIETESFCLSAGEITGEISDFDLGPEVEYINGDKIESGLYVRHWRAGDRMKPFGTVFEKKLSDIFIDAGINRLEKEEIPIVTHEENIVWVAGLKLSEDYKVSNETKRIVKLMFKRKV